MASAFTDSMLAACLPALIEAAERHPEVAECCTATTRDAGGPWSRIIQTRIDSGELPSHLDAELAALALIAPIVHCRTMTPDPLPAERTALLAAQVLGP